MRRGPLFMTLAGLMFSLMTLSVHVVRAELTATEVIWWRGLIGMPLALAFACGPGLRLNAHRAFVLRSIFGFGAMFCFYTAAKGLLVADLSVLSKLQPIFVALLAPLVLGRSERSGLFIWVLLLAGLAGCGILLAPALDVGNTYGLWALGGALVSAAAHVEIRALGETDDPRVVVFWLQVALLVIASAVLVGGDGELAALPSSASMWHLVALGITSTAGQLLLTYAYREDRASTVAAASYSAPLFAVALDWTVLGAAPSGNLLLGGGLVVAAGLVLVFRKA